MVRELIAAQIPGVFNQVGSRQFFALPALPYIAVADGGEQVQRVAYGYEHEVSVLVQIAIKAEYNADDVADTIAAYVETVLDTTLGGLAHDGWLSAVQVDASGEGDAQLLVKTLGFVFKYVTDTRNPTRSIH